MRPSLFGLCFAGLLLLDCAPITIGSPWQLASDGGAGGAVGGAGGQPQNSALGGVSGGGSGSNAVGGAVGAGAGAGGSSAGAGGLCANGALTLRGHVQLPLGAPLVHVSVRLLGDSSASTTTDVNGAYAFENLCSGHYQVAACGGSAVEVQLDMSQSVEFANVAPSSCDADTLHLRVLPVIYDPMVPGVSGQVERLSALLGGDAPEGLTQQFSAALEAATGGHVREEIAPVKVVPEFPPLVGGFRYSASSYASCVADPQHCRPEGADYEAISGEQSLCAALESANADEIWLIGASHFGFAPLRPLECSVLVDSQPVVKKIDVVGLSYDAGLTGLFTGYQARAVAALDQAFADFPAASGDSVYQLFSHVQGQTAGAPASGCGSLTFAPNALVASRFDDPRTAQSYCDAFLTDPLPTSPVSSARPITCSAWGCTEQGFRRYWLSHLPRARWLDAQGKLDDFWRYILHPEERLAQQPIRLNCSSSYAPGWCAHVSDGQQGTCNVAEWATQSEATGWVEFLYTPKRLVTGVQLYDRACEEQVLSGHLEFSDGSPNLPFGALEPSGTEYTAVNFPPKLLSGLRVVIDSSNGGVNPGFGEVTVSSVLP